MSSVPPPSRPGSAPDPGADGVETTAAALDRNAPAPVDLLSPQLTLRALLTGMLLGAVLSICNVYLGLRIGWGTNMSITGILIAYAFWTGARSASGGRLTQFGVLENNINQSACSAAAAVSSAGLVAPIPALAMLTGQTLSWPVLALWVFTVCLVGITVATGLRQQMIVVDRLPFPNGIACAETLREIYGHGAEAIRRVAMLGLAAIGAGTVKILSLVGTLKGWALPFSVRGYSARSLTFELEPSLLMVGVGGLIGFRAGASILLGAIVAWGVLGPAMMDRGVVPLTTTVPIIALPPGVTLEGDAPIRFNEARTRLERTGVPTEAMLASLTSLAPGDGVPERLFRQAVARLELQSRLNDGAPLAALPAGIDLSGVPVLYDAARGRLRAPGGLTPSEGALLRSRSDDPAWMAAVAHLESLYAYETSRPLRRSERLESIPRGLVIPQAYTGLLFIERDPEARGSGWLCAWWTPPASLVEELHQRSRELAGRDAAVADEVDAFRAALTRLAMPAPADAAASLMIPDALQGRVRIDDGGLVTAVGPLRRAEIDAWLAANAEADRDVLATIRTVGARSAFTPVGANFTDLLGWLLWPGVTLMVISSLVSFAFSWRSVLRAFTGSGPAAPGAPPPPDTGELAKKWFIAGMIVALVASVTLQVVLFEIIWWAAATGVALSFVLAVVASRVSGETNITPVGAMGKVTQLFFGVIVPKSAAANLMAANVTGGAASQCADLMHDFKCGWLLGASPRKQFIAQIAGALAGSIVGSLFYLILIPNPAEMLLTEEWPAPAVAAWKAVAELFMVGIEALPPGTPLAMLVAGIAGVILPVLDRVLPKRWRWLVPSAASFGLAFVVHAKYAVSMFIGATIAWILSRLFPKWSTRFVVTICAGIVVGDSLIGAGDALRIMIETTLFGE